MIDAKTLKNAVSLAESGRSTTEISKKLKIDIHLLRMLFTSLRKEGYLIPHNRESKIKNLLTKTKKILKK